MAPYLTMAVAVDMHLQGKLLAAHPNLSARDPFFHSVIYITSHTLESGAIGFVLNSPSRVNVGTLAALQDLDLACAEPVRHGGPLAQDSVYMIHSDEWVSPTSTIAGNGLCISTDQIMLEKLGWSEPAYWRIFAGYCGWAPGQLEKEVKGEPPFTASHSWVIADYSDELGFGCDSEDQWHTVIETAGRDLFDQYFN